MVQQKMSNRIRSILNRDEPNQQKHDRVMSSIRAVREQNYTDGFNNGIHNDSTRKPVRWYFVDDRSPRDIVDEAFTPGTPIDRQHTEIMYAVKAVRATSYSAGYFRGQRAAGHRDPSPSHLPDTGPQPPNGSLP